MYFYTVGNMLGIDKINKWATLLGLGVKSGIDLPNEVQGLVPSTEWKRETHAREVVRRRDHFGRRSARAQVSVTPVSMAVYMATLANGGTRVTPHLLKAVDDGNGLEAGAAAAAAVEGRHRSRRSSRRSATGCGWSSTAAAPAAARGSPGTTSRGKTGTAQVISNTGRAAAAAKRQGSARQRLVRVLRAARQPADCRRRVPRARHPRRRTPRRSRITSSTRSSRRRTASRCRRRRRTTTCASTSRTRTPAAAAARRVAASN